MDPIKPIEGALSSIQSQSLVLVDVVRERYWKEKAKANLPVDSSGLSQASSGTAKEKSQPKISQTNRTYAEFEVPPGSKDVIVRIIDANSGLVIRTIPAEELTKELSQDDLKSLQRRRTV
jgi:uncharacterized FlaG/YvyC family protein